MEISLTVGFKDFPAVPFHIDVTHVFSGDTGLIQSHFCGVPDDCTQEVP